MEYTSISGNYYSFSEGDIWDSLDVGYYALDLHYPYSDDLDIEDSDILERTITCADKYILTYLSIDFIDVPFEIGKDHVVELSRVIDLLPPIVVELNHCEGYTKVPYRVIDGCHRVSAHKFLGRDSILTFVPYINNMGNLIELAYNH